VPDRIVEKSGIARGEDLMRAVPYAQASREREQRPRGEIDHPDLIATEAETFRQQSGGEGCFPPLRDGGEQYARPLVRHRARVEKQGALRQPFDSGLANRPFEQWGEIVRLKPGPPQPPAF